MAKRLPIAVCLVACLALGSATAQGATEDFLLTWGAYGSGAGQFYGPFGIAVGPNDEIFVADTYNHRIQVFDSSGVFLRQWGSYGEAPGEFGYPKGIAIGPDGNIYVTDVGFTAGPTARVQVYTRSGTFVRSWGTYGTGDGQLSGPIGIAVNTAGTVYICDSGNNRIVECSSDSTWLGSWGGAGQFDNPFGIALGRQGDVYVTDGYRVQEFDGSGGFIRVWGGNGSSNGMFEGPQGLGVDRGGNVYVCDQTLDNVQAFSPSGAYLAKWGSKGAGNGQFQQPDGVAFDSAGNVYVVEYGNCRVQKFTPAVVVPTLQETWGALKARFR